MADPAVLKAILLSKKDKRVSEFITETFQGQKLFDGPVDEELSEYCCSDGTFHIFEDRIKVYDLGESYDEDEMKANRRTERGQCKVCRLCGKVKK